MTDSPLDENCQTTAKPQLTEQEACQSPDGGPFGGATPPPGDRPPAPSVDPTSTSTIVFKQHATPVGNRSRPTSRILGIRPVRIAAAVRRAFIGHLRESGSWRYAASQTSPPGS